MNVVRKRGEAIRKYILDNLESAPEDIVRLTANNFDCTRQAVHKHLQRLVAEGAISAHRKGRKKTYTIVPLVTWNNRYSIDHEVTESAVWSKDISLFFEKLPENVRDIWHYSFTEMFNNAIEHSGGTSVTVSLTKTASSTEIIIFDNGVGIFNKIQSALDLTDKRHAVLELAKGKFTTDPDNHSGEGIFFSSRMFDDFQISSDDVHYYHQFKRPEDWIFQEGKSEAGTKVRMKLSNHTSRTTKQVFDEYTTGGNYGFTKTVIPVMLMKYGDDNLVSRSQAKRLLAGFDRFEIVILDFLKISSIGQSFADEIFRVFKRNHPEIELNFVNACEDVEKMIRRALTFETGS